MIFQVILQLVILFFVIFDPLASFAVFITATVGMSHEERKKTASLALFVAAGLSLFVLLLGEKVLSLLNTNINEFRVAGGIILGILGVKMALGHPLTDIHSARNNSGRAIASIIGTPLLTGPAAMTSIIVAVHDYGHMLTGLSVAIVLLITALIFFQAERVNRIFGNTGIQVTSTFLGLVTVAWGVRFVITGIMAIL